MAGSGSVPQDPSGDLWDEVDHEDVWEDDHAGRLRGQADQLDPRAGRLLARVPAVSFGALALEDHDAGRKDGAEWFPGVKLLARTDEEYRLLIELRGLLITAADRAGVGRLIVKAPDGDSVDLFDAGGAGPGRADLLRSIDVLDTTPAEATSGWAGATGDVDGWHLTEREARVYRALMEMDLLFTPQSWVLHKGRRLYLLAFVVYHRGRVLAIEIGGPTPKGGDPDVSVRERFLRSKGLEVVHLEGSAVDTDIRACMALVVEALTRT